MNLNPDHYYPAMMSRDARFDGRFFAAVTTTGVYCRPICPTRKPRRQNIRFYPCAAAAEEDGFRPCLRCRPETAPGSAAWGGTSATVTRAMRLINQGFLDKAGADDLAQKLGVGSRHLRRLFQQHLGVTPRAIAHTQRLQFAKQLLDESRLAITDIVYASGFSSVRRFNAVFKGAFGSSPSRYRKKKVVSLHSKNGTNLTMAIRYRPPYHWPAVIRFLAARAIPGVEDINEHRYRRTVCLNGTAGIVEVRPDSPRNRLLVTVPRQLSSELISMVAGAKRLFDLDADPFTIEESLKTDPTLAAAIQRNPGMRVPGAWNGFEIAVRAILGQQVSVKGATTLSGRLVQTFGTTVPSLKDPDLTHLFPTPEQLCRADEVQIGMPMRRARAIAALANGVMHDNISLNDSTNPEKSIDALLALPGFGPWTAQYIAMRVMREPDAFPSGDLGLLRAVGRNRDGPVTESELLAQAEAWRPWRAYAAMMLWTHPA